MKSRFFYRRRLAKNSVLIGNVDFFGKLLPIGGRFSQFTETRDVSNSNASDPRTATCYKEKGRTRVSGGVRSLIGSASSALERRSLSRVRQRGADARRRSLCADGGASLAGSPELLCHDIMAVGQRESGSFGSSSAALSSSVNADLA